MGVRSGSHISDMVLENLNRSRRAISVFLCEYAILESEPIGRNCELPDGFILSDGDEEDESLWI